jgi:two-component system sensor histidine kinase RpfC
MKECREAGVDGFLTKPIEPAKLLDQIDRLAPKGAGSGIPDKAAANISDASTASGPVEHVLNDATLASLEIMGKRSSFIPELIHGFLHDTEGLLESMEKAMREKRYEDFKDLAHAMKGSAGSVGAQSLYDVCSGISGVSDEMLGKKASALMHDLVTQYESARYELLAYLDRRAAG